MQVRYKKKNLPVSKIRKYLEPGPIVLVSSRFKADTDIMTMGWHMIMGFQPSLIGCYIWNANYSFELIRKSKECVFNIPTVDMAQKVVKIGNSSGRSVDKFSKFKLTAKAAKKVQAPLIEECFANFECRLIETRFIKPYSFFIFEVLKAHVATYPEFPQTLHYRGEGKFMISGPTHSKYRKLFKKDRL